MLIINADDFGQNRLATDRTLACHKAGSVTSTSAMVFMEDSERAAERGLACGVDVGLHLNFTGPFTRPPRSSALVDDHARIVSFLNRSRYSSLIYHFALRMQFHRVCQMQWDEFIRLYRAKPSHVDGHHHMHLCANMLFDDTLPSGLKMRRNFSFFRGEKSLLNRAFRAVIDKWISRRFALPDYLFSLPECLKGGRLNRAIELAKTSNVELETHPEQDTDFAWLMGEDCRQAFSKVKTGTYEQLPVEKGGRHGLARTARA